MPTIAQAQAKALQGGFLNGLGSDRGSFKAPNLNTVEAMLALYAEEFLKAADDNLNKNNSVQSGSLSDSFRFEVKFMGRKVQMLFYAADYYDYVNEGVQGVKGGLNTTSPYKFKFLTPSLTHVQAIEKWIREGKKKIQVRDIKYGKTKQESKAITEKNLAYVIARAIKRRGLKRTGFWSEAFDDTFKDFGLQMAKVLGVDIRVDLQQMAKELKTKKGTGLGL